MNVMQCCSLGENLAPAVLLVAFVTVLPINTRVFKFTVHLQLHPSSSNAVCLVLVANLQVELEGFWFCDKECGEVHSGIAGACVCIGLVGRVVGRFLGMLLQLGIKASV